MRMWFIASALALTIPTAEAQVHKEHMQDLAYRAAGQIDRTWLSYERCLAQEPNGCQQFKDRYVNDLAPIMVAVDRRASELPEHPIARRLLLERLDKVMKMTQVLDTTNKLHELINQP